METFDLEKYRKAWKNETGISTEKLTSHDIQKLLKGSSTSLDQFFSKGLIFDIALKATLLLAIFGLFIIIQDWELFNYVDLISTIILLLGLGWQINVLRRIPRVSSGRLKVVENLRERIAFYYSDYMISIYIAALSATLVFIVGSNHYLRIKYHEIPQIKIDDFIVMSLGILLSYGFSAFIQLKYSRFRIRQLEQILQEIEEDTINKAGIIGQRSRQRNLTILFGVSVVTGLIILFYLIMFF